MARDLRYNVETSVSGAQDVDRLREGFEDLQETIRDVSGERLDVDVDPSSTEDLGQALDEVATKFDDVKARAAEAGAAVVSEAEATRAEMVQTRDAVDALANALGPELTAKADMAAVVAGFQKLGLTLDEIKQEADTLAAALKQADDVRLTGLAQGVNIADTNMKGLHSSSDQTRSVMANLAGNAAQDLGALSGVVGSLGVGIGQLAEYAVDGNIKLSELAKMAGPIAGVSALLFAITSANSAMKDFNQTQQTVKDEQQDFADALADSGSQIEVVNELLRENTELTAPPSLPGWADLLNDLPILGRLIVDADEASLGLVETMAAAGITQEQWNDALNSGLDNFGDFTRELERMHNAGEINDEQFALLTEQFTLYSDAALNAGVRTESTARVFETSMSGINFALQATRDEVQETGALWATVMHDMQGDQAITTQEGVDAWNRLKVVLGGISDQEMTDLVNSKLPERTKDGALAADAANIAFRQWEEAMQAVVETGAELADVASNLDVVALRADAVATAFDELNAHSDLTMSAEVVDFVANLDTLHEALHEATRAGVDLNNVDFFPDDWAQIHDMPEELVAVQDALVAFRESVQSEMAQAFEQGGATGVREWAEDTAAAVTENLARAGVTSRESVDEILGALGLLPDQVNIVIAIAAREQALATLDLLQGAIDGLPPEVQIQIAAVAATDPVAALQLAIDAFAAEGIAVPVELVALMDQLHADVAAEEQAPHSTTIQATLDTVQAHYDADTFTNTKRATKIDAIADTINAAGEMIEFQTRPRSATIVAHAHTGGAAIDLAAVAGPRTARITGDALTASAEAELNYAARSRTSTIYVNTVGGGDGGGGGGRRGMDAGAGPGPLGAGPLGAPSPRGAGETAAPVPTTFVPTTIVAEPATEIAVTINAGVIGNGFDVERAVYGAVQDAVRFRGQRRVLTVGGRNP